MIYKFDFTLNSVALDECIPFHSFLTATHRNMTENFTYCICRTNSRTWINAFTSQTCLFAGTVRVQNTFGSTSRVSISLVIGETFALTITALCIIATW